MDLKSEHASIHREYGRPPSHLRHPQIYGNHPRLICAHRRKVCRLRQTLFRQAQKARRTRPLPDAPARHAHALSDASNARQPSRSRTGARGGVGGPACRPRGRAAALAAPLHRAAPARPSARGHHFVLPVVHEGNDGTWRKGEDARRGLWAASAPPRAARAARVHRLRLVHVRGGWPPQRDHLPVVRGQLAVKAADHRPRLDA